MSGRWCVTNLIEFFEDVTKKVDEGKVENVFYMDFNKPFDKPLHGRLLWKVSLHRIHRELLSVCIRPSERDDGAVLMLSCLER